MSAMVAAATALRDALPPRESLYSRQDKVYALLADWLDAQHRHITGHDCEAHCEYPDGCQQTQIAYRMADVVLGVEDDSAEFARRILRDVSKGRR
jgi:hypothetical protein